MKKILVCLSVLLCTLLLTVGTAAEENLFMLDWADLLTAEEETELDNYLAAVSESHHANIIVATVDSLEGAGAQAYADDLYDAGLPYMGLCDGTEDGALLLLAMEERQWAVSTSGFAITAFTEEALDVVEYNVVPLLSEGDYFSAFASFGEIADLYLIAYAEWEQNPNAGYADPFYPENGGYDDSEFAFGSEWIFISLIIGFLIALIPMGVLKSQLHTVHMQTGAVPYQKTPGVRITDSRDLYLYRNLTKKPIPKENTSSGSSRPTGGGVHVSASGRSHGGRSGGF